MSNRRKRREIKPVDVALHVQDQMAAICGLRPPHRKAVRRRVSDIAHLICAVAVLDEHCRDMLEGFGLMVRHIGGDKDNPLLTGPQRGNIYAARKRLEEQMKHITTAALRQKTGAVARATEPYDHRLSPAGTERVDASTL